MEKETTATMNFSRHDNNDHTVTKHDDDHSDDATCCEMSLSTMETDPAELLQPSYSDLGFASLDLDRHRVRIRNFEDSDDGLGDSMFGESSFATDESNNFQERRAAAAAANSSAVPVVVEGDEESEQEEASLENSKASESA